MSSSLVQRYSFVVAGEPVEFANPFTTEVLALAQPPTTYAVVIAADTLATIWNTSTIVDDFTVFGVTSDQDLDLECTDGVTKFTLAVRGGGAPTILQGSRMHEGGVIAAETTITTINAKNRNTTTAANVTVFIAKASA